MTLRNQQGVTLVELLVAITIFAIVVAIAVPTFKEANERNQIKTVARQIKDELAKARITAMEKNTPVLLAFPAPNGDSSRSYQISVDSNDNCEVDGGEERKQIDMGKVFFSNNTLTKNTAGDHILQWDTRGYPQKKDGSFTNGTITISAFDNQFEIIISRVGNIRINKP
ncbi:GspH/FimT family pseudopilin [Desulfuromonas acetoxidans]|uniref:GspH/FimT family pseudopilin n=1 Tax=Desulfuromonas acetoxidans TaxID=891 RepID=UPI002930A355|nr:GspH/FimT family pseudopilin [Desulfuromonas acetoxidans]